MPTKEIRHRNGNFGEKIPYTVVQRWCMVHAITGRLATASQGSHTAATKKEIEIKIEGTLKNNHPDILQQFFPQGLRPRLFWCYDGHFDPCDAVKPEPFHIMTREHSGKWQWAIYPDRGKPEWNEGEESLKATKEKAEELFGGKITFHD